VKKSVYLKEEISCNILKYFYFFGLPGAFNGLEGALFSKV